MNEQCGCCEGTEKATPAATENRPGLDALNYRVGTHATFLETMKARLASFYLEVPRAETGPNTEPSPPTSPTYPLSGLATRESDDPAIGLLDAWATVGDVLTFYQERIANEGYLRTAGERRSVLELARLIDYSVRPGVASSSFLALTLEKGHTIKLKPGEIRAQSLPGPGELPQTFENSEALEARAEWNTLGPRMSRPQTREAIQLIRSEDNLARLYLKGVSTNLGKSDPLLIDFGDGTSPVLFRVIEVVTDSAADRTLVKLQPWIRPSLVGGIKALKETITRLSNEGLNLSGQTVRKALALLSDLNELIEGGANAADLRTPIDNALATFSEMAGRLPRTARLAGPFLNKMITELGEAGAASALAATSSGSRLSRQIFVDGRGDELRGVIPELIKPASIPPRNSLQLAQDVGTSFSARADTGLQLAGAFQPTLRGSVQTAMKNVVVTRRNPIRAYALRAKAAPFGHNAPLKSAVLDNDPNDVLFARRTGKSVEYSEWPDSEIVEAEELTDRRNNVIYLDASYDKVLPNSWVVLDLSAVHIDPTKSQVSMPDPKQILLIARTGEPQANLSRAAYGYSGPTTRIDLFDPNNPSKAKPWMIRTDVDAKGKLGFQMIRRTAVYAQSEELPLAEEPIDEPICDGTGEDGELELNDLYSELKAGRWLIVSGERGDIKVDPSANAVPGNIVGGIRASELAMLAEVRHDVASTGGGVLQGDRNHTFIKLAKKLEYCYRRDAVTIYANVVKATHGETRNEVLGAGDATKPFQSFTLRQPPLTYVASPTPAGADSTLNVYVNDVEWTETGTLAALSPTDRKFVTRDDDEGKTTVVFGNGERGARLPTGLENIRAVYRNGIGKPGNVAAEQISQLMARPLGVKDVINPMRASGGADKESRDQARKNAPLTVTALDRLVSTDDYADFARTFAGIGKSLAARFSDGRRELVHVTIAGADDIPIDESSDLFRNLTQALRRFGDPYQPLKVEVRELMFLVISAGIRILPGYLWEPVVTNVRVRLLDTFSFDRRELGQDALLSEAVSAIQAARGVSYVDVNIFGGVPEKTVDLASGTRRLQTPQEILKAVQDLNAPAPRVAVSLADLEKGVIHPAQQAYLTPEVPATLILNQIEAEPK